MNKKHRKWLEKLDDVNQVLQDLMLDLSEDADDNGIKEQVQDAGYLLSEVKTALAEQKRLLDSIRKHLPKKEKVPPTREQTFNALKSIQEWSESHPDDGLSKDILTVLHSPHCSLKVTA